MVRKAAWTRYEPFPRALAVRTAARRPRIWRLAADLDNEVPRELEIPGMASRLGALRHPERPQRALDVVLARRIAPDKMLGRVVVDFQRLRGGHPAMAALRRIRRIGGANAGVCYGRRRAVGWLRGSVSPDSATAKVSKPSTETELLGRPAGSAGK
jgi:hypothetical protein